MLLEKKITIWRLYMTTIEGKLTFIKEDAHYMITKIIHGMILSFIICIFYYL